MTPARPQPDTLPAIEYVETTDDGLNRRYTVRFVDGREIEFTVNRIDMAHLSKLMVMMRTQQAFDAKYTAS